MTEESSNEENWSGSRQPSEVFTYKKTSTTTNDFRSAFTDAESTEKSVVRRSTVSKFSEGSGGFKPSFSKTEQIWMMGDDEIRQGSRMKWVKNRIDI